MAGDSALIVGAGPGLSAALARRLAGRGMRVALAARDIGKLAGLCAATGAQAYACDARDPAAVAELFRTVEAAQGVPEVVVYNASARVRGAVHEIDPDAVRAAWEVTAFGAFLVAREAVTRMLPLGRGVILLSGATAGVKGFARSSSFAMGKFALRGLAQSLAREVAPAGIHVAHVVIDGGIASALRPVPADAPDSLLDPAAIADTYLHLIDQPRSAWSWEIEVRPWVEKF